MRTKYRFYEMWGHSTFDPMVWLWSIDGPGSGWAGKIEGVRRKTMDWARNRLRLTVSNLDSQQLRNHLARIAAYRPTAIYGFSHAVHLLAREALDVGFSCDSLKLINLSGEAATERMVTNIERAFGVPAVMEYGCIEFGMIAGELPDRKMRVREDIALVETLKRKDDRYDLVLTALNNPSFPILRYDIGDTTNGPIIHQSNGFSILPKVSGRDDDLIVSQSGRILSPTDIDQLFEYDHCKVVRRYRVHQHADGALAVTLELSDSGRESDVVKLRQQLESLVEGYRVDLQIADSIEQTAAGKHRVITSELAKED
ncbi:MAG: hypothetical protein GY697_12170 [Desulfobacterales bacterium]|nr:hypothetical protein [Desulfobacterales bacterium]